MPEKKRAGELEFDFVLLLFIGEATQQALLGNDFSMMNACLIIVTLIGIDIIISLLKQRWKKLEKFVDSVPLVLVENGHPIAERINMSRVDEADIMAKACELQGLERMEQIKYAVLERSGGISIIPQSKKMRFSNDPNRKS